MPVHVAAPVAARRFGFRAGRGLMAFVSGPTLLVASLVAAGCGDRSDKAPPPVGGGSNGTPVRAGQRLAWDQPAPNVDILQSYQFQLYVDGVRAELTDPQCSTTLRDSGYECSGRLPSLTPGVHVLQLTAFVPGLVSERSAPFNVVIIASTQGSAAPGVEPLTMDASPPVCAASGAACFDVDLLGSVPGQLTSPVATPDGRLLVVQDRRAVRVVDETGVMTRPAFESGDEIESLAIAPDFAESHVVYVATLDARAAPAPSLAVTRYREVGDILGEGAVIVPGVPLAVARLALDEQDRIYVAGSADAGTAAEGLVLRVTRDGRVPWDSGQTSITLASGVVAPRAFLYDARDGVLWLAGLSPARAPHVRRLQVQRAAAPGALDVRTLPDQPLHLESVAMLTTTKLPGLLLVDGDRRLAYSTLDPQGAIMPTVIDFPPGAITGVAAAPGVDPYLTVRDQAADETKIFRLRPR